MIDLEDRRETARTGITTSQRKETRRELATAPVDAADSSSPGGLAQVQTEAVRLCRNNPHRAAHEDRRWVVFVCSPHETDLRQLMPGWHRCSNGIVLSSTFPMPREPAPIPAADPEHPLARAFASFTEAAGSLERTYGQLQGEVAHLRQELEVRNRDLASNLDENHRIRACAAFSKQCSPASCAQ